MAMTGGRVVVRSDLGLYVVDATLGWFSSRLCVMLCANPEGDVQKAVLPNHLLIQHATRQIWVLRTCNLGSCA